MQRQHGALEDGTKFFEYHASFTSGITRIEWQGDITVIPIDAARAVVSRGFARYLTDLEIAAWNDAVDKYEEEQALAAKAAADAPPPPAPKPEDEKDQQKIPLGDEKEPDQKLTPEQEALLKKAEEAASKAPKKSSTEE